MQGIESPALPHCDPRAKLRDPAPYELQVLQRETRLSSFDLATGAQRELVTLSAGTTVNGLAWSPDGARLALSHTSVFAYDRSCPPNDDRCRDGARLSEAPYRDVTGNLSPSDNPLLQRSVVDTLSRLALSAARNCVFLAPACAAAMVAAMATSY